MKSVTEKKILKLIPIGKIICTFILSYRTVIKGTF